MAIDNTNYLDLGNIFFNELIGDVFLGVIVGLFFIVFISAKSKLHSEVTLLICALWIAAVFAYDTGLLILWIFVVLLSAITFYYSFSKGLTR